DCGECPSPCGNGQLDLGEVCDGGTFCLPDCSCPMGYESDGAGDCNYIETCGNGNCAVGEDCSECPQDCGECPSPCGNGQLDLGEVCDGGFYCLPDCSCPLGFTSDGAGDCTLLLGPDPELCYDGEDNDGDGDVDSLDSECCPNGSTELASFTIKYFGTSPEFTCTDINGASGVSAIGKVSMTNQELLPPLGTGSLWSKCYTDPENDGHFSFPYASCGDDYVNVVVTISKGYIEADDMGLYYWEVDDVAPTYLAPGYFKDFDYATEQEVQVLLIHANSVHPIGWDPAWNAGL
ncbi:hypothetical protein HN709_03600, partial [Candidatus Peregrinibacteria bacterium]|nr:hypothetical protein [Candidatus Peregrinibacteria bacterium]